MWLFVAVEGGCCSEATHEFSGTIHISPPAHHWVGWWPPPSHVAAHPCGSLCVALLGQHRGGFSWMLLASCSLPATRLFLAGGSTYTQLNPPPPPAGFIKVASPQVAERARDLVKTACGVPVALSIPGAKTLQDLHEEAMAAVAADPLEPPADGSSSVARLLQALEGQEDKQQAALAALAAVLRVPKRPKLAFPPQKEAAVQAAAAARAGKQAPAQEQKGIKGAQPAARGGPAAAAAAAAAAAGEAPEDPLGQCPKVKSLMVRFKERSMEKTPLAVVYEYAGRLMLDVVMDQVDEGPGGGGPFTLEARLTSHRGTQTFASGTGAGRNKQLARQAAGAALLESLLQTVPEDDLLVAGKGKQGWQVGSASQEWGWQSWDGQAGVTDGWCLECGWWGRGEVGLQNHGVAGQAVRS